MQMPWLTRNPIIELKFQAQNRYFFLLMKWDEGPSWTVAYVHVGSVDICLTYIFLSTVRLHTSCMRPARYICQTIRDSPTPTLSCLAVDRSNLSCKLQFVYVPFRPWCVRMKVNGCANQNFVYHCQFRSERAFGKANCRVRRVKEKTEDANDSNDDDFWHGSIIVNRTSLTAVMATNKTTGNHLSFILSVRISVDRMFSMELQLSSKRWTYTTNVHRHTTTQQRKLEKVEANQ